MSHFPVLVVVREADNAIHAHILAAESLEPFNENLEVPHHVTVSDDEVAQATATFREHPEYSDDGVPCKFEDIPVGDLDAFIRWQRHCVGAYYASDPEAGTHDTKTGTFGYHSTWNPDGKWDWHQLGGRWHGYFQTKPAVKVGAEPMPGWRRAMGTIGKDSIEATDRFKEIDVRHHDAMLGLSGAGGDSPDENFSGRADLARKRDIDFDAMMSLTRHQAEMAYDKFEATTAGIELAPRWMDVMKLHLVEAGIDPERMDWRDATPAEVATRDLAMNRAREAFRDHPWVQALHQAELAPMFDDLHEYWCVNAGGREAFVRRAGLSAVTTHAVVVDGEWRESGQMGWFGMSSDDKDPDLWAREFFQLLDGLPDDCWLAVFDCHV